MAKLDDGLALLNQLDETLAVMLTPPAGPSGAQSDARPTDQEKAARQFAETAGQIERILLQSRSTPPASAQAQLQQEVQELERALASKERLIKTCHESIRNWKQTCGKLDEQHHKVVFD